LSKLGNIFEGRGVRMDVRIPTTAQVGCVVFRAAITGFLGTRHWVASRTLRAVDTPISLARAIVSAGPFNLSFHGFYSLLVGKEQGGHSRCNIGLETRRISSIGGLPVYLYRWLEDQSRSTDEILSLRLKSCLTRAVWMPASRACT